MKKKIVWCWNTGYTGCFRERKACFRACFIFAVSFFFVSFFFRNNFITNIPPPFFFPYEIYLFFSYMNMNIYISFPTFRISPSVPLILPTRHSSVPIFPTMFGVSMFVLINLPYIFFIFVCCYSTFVLFFLSLRSPRLARISSLYI